jgi:hypothetical protein
MIDFGAQMGSMECQKIVSPYKRELLEIFSGNEDMNGYFINLVKLLIVFRVSGKNKNFGGEGPDCLEFIKSEKILGIDLLIPQERWKNQAPANIRKYLSESVRECFSQLVKKAQDLGEVRDEEKLLLDFEKGIVKFEKR